MGSKGQSTTQTNQTQTYAPAGAGYVTNALDRASNVAQTPFNVPQAPVAGFSQDQQTAFGNINAAQGMAQPYINQAANYFTPQGTQAFLNPYAQNVMAGLQNVFGQQQSQATGQLTQAAGGVGADRIAVGQANLANQQGLAAGQTLSSLYNNAAQQAQSAGYGTAALGSQAQNAALTGAQAQLASGGLQQQLQQAQLNAPYQQALAQSQFPYQQASWLANITGALAPGLGGTTTGTGNSASTPAQPSVWSQILGGAGVGTAALGYLNSQGAFGGGNGYQPQGDTGAWGLANTGASGSAFQGPPAPDGYAEGGAAYAEGGAENGTEGGSQFGPAGDAPIDISAHPFIPQDQIAKIAPTMPQLNLNPPQQQQQSGGGGIGDIMKIAAMFMRDGGAVNPYARGGRAYADAGVVPDFVDRWDDAFPQRDRRDDPPPARSVTGTGLPGDTPYEDVSPGAMDKWRRDVDADRAAGVTAQNGDQPDPSRALAYAQPPPAAPAAPAVQAINKAAGAPNPYKPPPPAPEAEEPQAEPAAKPGANPRASKHNGFIDSPWAALAAASLGIMGGASPFAGVNIGQGAQQGLKMLQQQRENSQKDTTIQQAAKAQEDPYNRLTKAQQEQQRYHEWEMGKPVPGGQTYDPQTGRLKTQYLQPETGPDGKITWKPVTMDAGPQLDANGQPVKPIHERIGDAIIEGRQLPYFSNMGQSAPQVRAYLESKGFNQAKAFMEAKQAEKQLQALNGPQMTRGYNLYRSVNDTIDRVSELSKQMELGGIPMLNNLELQKYIKTEGNSPNGQLATQYMTAVNTLKEEFANLANGGYAPTEPAWKLADEQINGNYGVKQLGASLGEIKRLVGYRMKFIADSPIGPGSGNRYTGQQPQGAPAGGEAPAGGGAASEPPPASMLKEGVGTKFKNGETWTLKNGQPVKVP